MASGPWRKERRGRQQKEPGKGGFGGSRRRSGSGGGGGRVGQHITRYADFALPHRHRFPADRRGSLGNKLAVLSWRARDTVATVA